MNASTPQPQKYFPSNSRGDGVDEPVTRRIFVATDDLLELDALSSQHDCKLTIGGDPLMVPTMARFERPGTLNKWSVCYLSGALMQLIELRAKWLRHMGVDELSEPATPSYAGSHEGRRAVFGAREAGTFL